ncbi:MAG TPA: nitrous oxide reductase accessory protein NosL [Vicinamibacterales bacterium]|nr:nitrous oxide reductase accessory protein NosL [Vicinamibacterales bacterium]
MMRALRLCVGVGCLATLSCSAGPPGPATLDTRNEACAHCRMIVSDQRFASQLVAPGEEPRFFDDIGCLRNFLREQRVAEGAIAYVADHRTRAWVPAAGAVYVRNEQVRTPMASHLLAYADAPSRDADEDGKGTRLTPSDLFGQNGPPAGR